MLKRIMLFVVMNAAIILVGSIILRIFGFDSYLNANYQLNYDSLFMFSLVFGFLGSFISLWMSKWMAKSLMGVKIIQSANNQRETWLLKTIENYAKTAGIKTPEFGIFDSSAPNAFATGASKNSSLVAVSTGLLNAMDEKEVEAVIGHEIAHIANGDMVTMALLQGVLNTFVLFFSRILGHFVDRVLLKNEEGYGIGYFVAVIFFQIVLGILASTVMAWYSRKREFKADEGGAYLAGNGNMIAALTRLQTQSAGDLPEQLAAFGINKSVTKNSKMQTFAKLFATHPPIPVRIKHLQSLEKARLKT